MHKSDEHHSQGLLWTRRSYLRAISAFGGLVAATKVMPAGAQSTYPLHVLLLGNSRYRHNAALQNPARDIELLTRTFTARGGKVTALLDQTAAQMDAAVTAFLKRIQATPNVAVWLGYSGHAVQVDGINYLQGIDSDFSTPTKVRNHGLNLEKVLRLMDRARPQAAVLSIDACRDNPFEPERTRGVLQGLAAVEPKGICVSFSTAPYAKALDGDIGAYSPYAQALAHALQDAPSKSLDQVLRETADAVFARTNKRQIPEYRSALRADWWFEPKAVSLRGTQTTMASGSVSGAATRDVAYRPDEPANSHGPAKDARNWSAVERAMAEQRSRLTRTQWQQLQMKAKHGTLTDDERLLAGWVHLEGMREVPPDVLQARKLLAPLAEKNHVVAQNLLGQAWFASKDFAQAYKWLSLAARSGYGPAMINLGQLKMMGVDGADPTAGAMQSLQGMYEQLKEIIPQANSNPQISPDAQQELGRLLNMVNGKR